jgi:ABC-type amino acid transport system permease subunit
LIYLVISVTAIFAARYYVPIAVRWRLLGLAAGQLIGGLLFYFGIIPNNSLFRVEVYPALILSRRGLVLPEIMPTARFTEWMIFVVIGLVLAGVLWVYFGRITETTGRPTRRLTYAIFSIAAFAIIGWGLTGVAPVPTTIPVQQADGTTAFMTVADADAAGLLTRADEQFYSQSPILYIPPVQKISPAGIVSGLESGSQITPEYTALLLGLVIYTAAFIAEIVRAGILAVPPGQLEAARALGLSTTQTLTIVILPQALRVIIPPLGNQYLNLSKNSSLAIAVAYADIVLVTTTIMNQSGQSVTGIVMIMLTYLAISLLIAAATNLVNRRFQLVTR